MNRGGVAPATPLSRLASHSHPPSQRLRAPVAARCSLPLHLPNDEFRPFTTSVCGNRLLSRLAQKTKLLNTTRPLLSASKDGYNESPTRSWSG
jgi:hypothetical protein